MTKDQKVILVTWCIVKIIHRVNVDTLTWKASHADQMEIKYYPVSPMKVTQPSTS